jgi:hypothetical protein
MANNRIFYACQSAAIKHREIQSDGTWSGGSNLTHQCEGLQSVGINTNFNLEQIFELGQLGIYENVEGIPEVEVTMEKALDGKRLLYHCCSTQGEVLSKTSADRADVGIKIFADSGNADGTAGLSEVIATGMCQISHIRFQLTETQLNQLLSLAMPKSGKVILLVIHLLQWLLIRLELLLA